MADFRKAFDKMMDYEGLYANDPRDPGGETYAGISRRAFPDWPGWKRLDGISDKNGAWIYNMVTPVLDFYRVNFWNKFLGDAIQVQEIAEELFEFAVNAGVPGAVKALQSALNLLNRKGMSYLDVEVDGNMGQQTLSAVNWFGYSGREGDADALFAAQNIFQGIYYVNLMKSRPEMEIFARSWFKRVSTKRRNIA